MTSQTSTTTTTSANSPWIKLENGNAIIHPRRPIPCTHGSSAMIENTSSAYNTGSQSGTVIGIKRPWENEDEEESKWDQGSSDKDVQMKDEWETDTDSQLETLSGKKTKFGGM